MVRKHFNVFMHVTYIYTVYHNTSVHHYRYPGNQNDELSCWCQLLDVMNLHVYVRCSHGQCCKILNRSSMNKVLLIKSYGHNLPHSTYTQYKSSNFHLPFPLEVFVICFSMDTTVQEQKKLAALKRRSWFPCDIELGVLSFAINYDYTHTTHSHTHAHNRITISITYTCNPMHLVGLQYIIQYISKPYACKATT